MNLLIIFAAKYLFIVVILLAIIYWLLAPRKQKKFLLINGAISLILAYLLVKLAGKLFYDPRPFVTEHIKPLVDHAADNGFPSEHTTYTAAIAFVLIQTSRKWGVIALVLAIFVGLGRIGAHVHSPLDILGGLFVAAIAVALARLITNLFMKKREPAHDLDQQQKPTNLQ